MGLYETYETLHQFVKLITLKKNLKFNWKIFTHLSTPGSISKSALKANATQKINKNQQLHTRSYNCINLTRRCSVRFHFALKLNGAW